MAIRDSSAAMKIWHEMKEMFAILAYLWVVFGIFALHESIVSARNHIEFHFYGFAIINAIVFAKVVLIAEKLHLADAFRDRPLVVPIGLKSIVFATLLVSFHMIEETVVGLVKGHEFADSVPDVGGGGVWGVIFVWIIISVCLIPFFAFRELARVIGPSELKSLFVKSPLGRQPDRHRH